MKTKEEILNAELGTVNMDSAIEITCASLRAMQLYSDQQNKELREAMLNLQSECGYLQKFKDGVDAEIQRLTKEVEELKIRARHAEKQLLRDVKKVWDEGADKRDPLIDLTKDPNQDELWEEFWRNCVESDRGQEYFDYEEAKKRYRITRVK